MSEPYFSIIVAMCNQETAVGRAVESCLSHTFTDFELVVVDDGSTDASVDVVQRYQDAL